MNSLGPPVRTVKKQLICRTDTVLPEGGLCDGSISENVNTRCSNERSWSIFVKNMGLWKVMLTRLPCLCEAPVGKAKREGCREGGVQPPGVEGCSLQQKERSLASVSMDTF